MWSRLGVLDVLQWYDHPSLDTRCDAVMQTLQLMDADASSLKPMTGFRNRCNHNACSLPISCERLEQNDLTSQVPFISVGLQLSMNLGLLLILCTHSRLVITN